MDHQDSLASDIEMQIQASARLPSWKLYYMVPEPFALGLTLTILALAALYASLFNSTISDNLEQWPESENPLTSQGKVSTTELATPEAGIVDEKPPKRDQDSQTAKAPKKVKHPKKEKARKRKASMLHQDRLLQNDIISEPGMPKGELVMTGGATTTTGTTVLEKGKVTSTTRQSSDMPNKEVGNMVFETAQSTSEENPTITSPSRQPLCSLGKKTTKSRKRTHAFHVDLAEEDATMKNQPYPRVKIQNDPKESKRYAEWAVHNISGKRMFVFTDGGSCVQGSSAAFTYTCLSERQLQQQESWHDVSYGIIGDVQSREAEMIALTKALEAVEMEAKRQPLDAESPLRAIVFTDSRDNLHFCQAILSNENTHLVSGSLARNNVNQALKEMVDRMWSINSTVKLELHWVKGHSSIYHNTRADSLATSALHAVKDYIRYARHETARDSKGYDLIPFADMKRPEEIIAQQAYDMVQELQKEMRAATQQHTDTMTAFEARLEAQTRAADQMIGFLDRLVAIKNPVLVDLHSVSVAVASQQSPTEATNPPEDKLTDVDSVTRSQESDEDAQGITTDKQGCPSESLEPKEELVRPTDENATPKRLGRRRQAALIFVRVSKSLHVWSRSN